MWKILNASITATDDKGHVKFFSASDVTITVIDKNKAEKPAPKKSEIKSVIKKITKPLKSKKSKKSGK